jgi:hypothetical protein
MLVWHYRPQHGVSVRFVQEGGTPTQVPSKGGRGQTRFSISPGPGGIRRVVAYVSVDGFPRQRLIAATFTAPPPVPPRSARASYSISRKIVAVQWAHVQGADFYYVDMRLANGVQRYWVPGSVKQIKVSLPPAARVVHVTISTTANSITGPPREARLMHPGRSH